MLPDKLGGVVSIVSDLLRHGNRDAFELDAVLVDPLLGIDARFGGTLPADRQSTLAHSLPVENLYAVLARLHRLIDPGPGILVANDWLELALAESTDLGQGVVQILHGDYDYYYDLARRHAGVVDRFVTYSQAMYRNLLQVLPERAADIRYLPYGIAIPETPRRPAAGPLRLVFCGRLDPQKGVGDLPKIAARLEARGDAVTWTIVGDGPDGPALRREWTAPNVTWTGALSHERAVEVVGQHDVLVLPTRAEGFSVALLEAMASGVVPVVSAIETGMGEVVNPSTGCLAPVGDIDGFAAGISGLVGDRPRFERMSAAARETVSARFDIRERSRDYDALYAEILAQPRPKLRPARVSYGSRLDRPWFPNPLVRVVRTPLRWWRLRRARPEAR